jgi:lactate dehydrogenase-like 2-hydroxyacid dehydrogenase
LEELDFLSLNVPLTADTYHIIDEKDFSMRKPSAFLINTSIGSLVDEYVLVDTLKNNHIRGDALIVSEFGNYLLPELLELENVVLTLHISTQTLNVRLDMIHAVCNILLISSRTIVP